MIFITPNEIGQFSEMGKDGKVILSNVYCTITHSLH